MFAQSDEELKKAITEKGFVEYLTSISDQMGQIRISTQRGQTTNYSTAGTFFSLRYEAKHDHGIVVEDFTFV
jgi:hypothetical protein